MPGFHPLLSPRVCSNSCPLVNDAIAPLSSCPQSFPASGSFPMSRLLASGSQTIGAPVLVLPMIIQGLSPLGFTGLICLLSKGLSRVFSSTTDQRHQVVSDQPFFIVQLSHSYITTGKIKALTIQTLSGK